MKNNDFQIAWCETNLRWLVGEPPSDERTRRIQAMISEIERLSQDNKSEMKAGE